jgi:hypothetical protein
VDTSTSDEEAAVIDFFKVIDFILWVARGAALGMFAGGVAAAILWFFR